MRGKGLLTAGLVVTALAASVASAPAAVTIGSNLATPDTTNAPGCNTSCTAVNLALPASSTAPGGLNSPVNGTVTSWSVRANTGPNLRLRVLRPAAGTTFSGVATSGPAGFTGPGISNPIATALPISLGDAIGLDSPNGNLIFGLTPAGTTAFWNMPVLADGATRQADGTGSGRELLVQATIEPTNTVTFGAITRNKKKGTATVTVTVPNPGQLIYAGTGVSVTGPASVTAPGDIQVTVRATGKKAKKLKRKGKTSVSFGTTFTPNFGAAGIAPESIILRKKLKK